MALYPTTPQKHGSVKETSFGTRVDLAVSGRPRLRSLYSQQWATFMLLHECTTAQKDAILAHYAAHENISFTMTFQGDGVTYTVKYAEIPQTKTGNLNFEWEVQTLLVGV